MAGIENADVLVSVDGVSAGTLDAEELVLRLRDEGPSYTTIEWRSGKFQGALLKRQIRRQIVVVDEQVAVVDMGDHVYLSLPNFYASTPALTLRGLRNLNGRLHLPKVLDLRGNAGGVLIAAQWMLAAFGQTSESSWVPVRYRKPGMDAPFDARALLNSPQVVPLGRGGPNEMAQKALAQGGKLYVLIDGQTGSGAAWLAGALRELNGAVVMGSASRPDPPGVDVVNPLRSSDALYAVKYEIGKLAYPSGKLMLDGTLLPDVFVEQQPDPGGREVGNAESWKADPLFQQMKIQLQARP
jgi:C-terminal processing protease CtpA/Prc